MIESEMNFSVNAEEQEMINIALNHFLDVAMELNTEDNERTLILKRVRDKSYELWARRFDQSKDIDILVDETENFGTIHGFTI